MKKPLTALMSFFLIFQSLPANAASVTATGSNPSICNQIVGNSSNVVAYRISNGDCVVEFKSVGTTTWNVPVNITSVRYLIVGGGASGDRGRCSYYWGHGGGGGEVLENTLSLTPSANYTVTVGDGGGATANCTNIPTGNPGGTSTFYNITARGGQPANPNSQTGGTSGSGKLGGTSTGGTSGCTPGGCGAGSGGGAKNSGFGVNGGAGIESSITDSLIEYGGGGAGRIAGDFGTASGGGAAGSAPTPNLGGGGSDSSANGVSTAGGSGIVIIRYSPITDQTITLSSLGTSSKTYPYSQALIMSTTGSSGSGAITYAVTNGSATGCALSNSSSSSTLTASTSGTCLITATIAADSNYNSATSSALTFTFSKANQLSLSITSTTAPYGSPLTLSTSGGSSGEVVTYEYAPGTKTCTLDAGVLTSTAAGTCLVTATMAGNTNYNAISSIQTTITFTKTSVNATIELIQGALTYRQAKSVSASSSVAGKVTFKVNGKVIPGCKRRAVAANALVVCSYRPSTRGYVVITATLNPTDDSYIGTTTTTSRYFVGNRSGRRAG